MSSSNSVRYAQTAQPLIALLYTLFSKTCRVTSIAILNDVIRMQLRNSWYVHAPYPPPAIAFGTDEPPHVLAALDMGLYPMWTPVMP